MKAVAQARACRQSRRVVGPANIQMMGTTGSYKRSPYTSVPWIPRPELDLLLDWWESGVEVPILVEGTAGAGKSRLLRVLAEEVAQRVRDPRAVLVRPLVAGPRLRTGDLAEQVSAGARALVALDNPWNTPDSREQVVEVVEQLHARYPQLTIVTAAFPDPLYPAHWARVELAPAAPDVGMALLRALDVVATPEELARLIDVGEGGPALLVALASMAHSEPVEDVLRRVEAQRFEGVYPEEWHFAS